MRIRLLNKRHDDARCDGIKMIVTLAEAVKRWHETGDFSLAETDLPAQYDTDEPAKLDLGAVSYAYSKIDTALKGLDIMNSPTVEPDVKPIDKVDPEVVTDPVVE